MKKTVDNNNNEIEMEVDQGSDTDVNKTDLEATYESLLEKVELILNQLDHKEIPLDEAISKYKEGMELINACNNKLDRAEKELRIIEGE